MHTKTFRELPVGSYFLGIGKGFKADNILDLCRKVSDCEYQVKKIIQGKPWVVRDLTPSMDALVFHKF